MWQILCRASPPTVDEHAVIPESILSILAVCSMMALSQLSPGPDVFFVFRTSLAQGYKRGLAVALGINTGVFVQGIIICTLGSYVLDQSWSRWIIYAAAAWLLYLRGKSSRSQTALPQESSRTSKRQGSLFPTCSFRDSCATYSMQNVTCFWQD